MKNSSQYEETLVESAGGSLSLRAPSDDSTSGSHTSVPVYDLIRAGIMSGSHPPGSRLVESQLATAFGVSRTPVRAALARLEGDGLVESIPNRGAFVTDWTETDFEEVYALRIRLEPLASNLAAGRFAAAELDRLDEIATTMVRLAESEEDGWTERCSELNAELHASILRASDSPRLIAIVSSLSEQPLIRRAISLLPQDTLRRNFEQHHQILQAIRQGDGEWAEALMTAHIMGARQALRLRGTTRFR